MFQLWKRFKGSDKPPAELGSSRDYNVDMIPKVFPFSLSICFTETKHSIVCVVLNLLFFGAVYYGKWCSCAGANSY